MVQPLPGWGRSVKSLTLHQPASMTFKSGSIYFTHNRGLRSCSGVFRSVRVASLLDSSKAKAGNHELRLRSDSNQLDGVAMGRWLSSRRTSHFRANNKHTKLGNLGFRWFGAAAGNEGDGKEATKEPMGAGAGITKRKLPDESPSNQNDWLRDEDCDGDAERICTQGDGTTKFGAGAATGDASLFGQAEEVLDKDENERFQKNRTRKREKMEKEGNCEMKTKEGTSEGTADATLSEQDSGKKIESDVDGTPIDHDKIDPRVWPITLSSGLIGVAVGVIVPLMPIFANELGLTSTQLGIVVGVMGLTRLLLNIPVAIFTDRNGRKPMLVMGPALTAVGIGLTGLSQSFSQLCGSRLLAGAGSSMQMSGAQLYLADISTPRNRARTMAPMNIAFMAGSLAGPVIGGYLGDIYGLRAPFYFCAAGISLMVLNNMRLPETADPARMAKAKADTNFRLRSEITKTIAKWKKLGQNTNIQTSAIVHGTYWMVASGLQFTLLPLLAQRMWDFDPSQIGLMFAGMTCVNLCLIKPAAYVSDKFGRKSIVLPASLLIAAATMAIPLATNVIAFKALTMLWACGTGILGSTPTAFVADSTTDRERPHALALQRSAGDVGVMCGAAMFGFIADATGHLEPSFALASLMTLSYGIQFTMRAVERPHIETVKESIKDEEKSQ